MLTLTRIRNQKDALVEAYKKRQLDALPLLNKAIELDDRRKHTQHELDDLLAKSNELSRKIGELFKSGQHQEGNALREETAGLKDQITGLKDQMHSIEDELKETLYHIPNVPHQSVTAGKSEEDNVEISMHGELPVLPSDAEPH